MNDLNMRMPSGNEAGANDQWLSGGYLPSGQNEAVIDGVKSTVDHFTKSVLAMTRFVDSHVSREGRFSLGIDQAASDHYLSIPVANRMVTYEEYYRLAKGQYNLFVEDSSSAMHFADECRRREHDDQLILPPGNDRGSAL